MRPQGRCDASVRFGGAKWTLMSSEASSSRRTPGTIAFQVPHPKLATPR
jgi:hypothetical protein